MPRKLGSEAIRRIERVREEVQPHIDAIIRAISVGAAAEASRNPDTSLGAQQFAYGGITIQLFVDTLLNACPDMSRGKDRELFDINYATAIKFGTMLYFAKRDAGK